MCCVYMYICGVNECVCVCVCVCVCECVCVCVFGGLGLGMGCFSHNNKDLLRAVSVTIEWN